MGSRTSAVELLGAVVLLACAASGAGAQAWLPSGGSSNVSLIYNDVLNRKHYLPNGDEIDVGHTRAHTLGLALNWSPSDRLMLNAALPYVRTSYWGERPHAGTHVDDGATRGTLTDLRVEAHYQWREGPVAIAPYVALVVPVRDYPTLGHAAPGRGLQELWLGSFFGKSLDEWLPSTWVQLRYSYSFVEKVAGIAHDRSNADLEFGWFVDPRWALRATLAWQFTHGGIDVPVPPSNPLYPYHDQLAAEHFTQAGAGVSWFPSDTFAISATYTQALRGRNGHKVDQGLNLSMSFSPGWRP